jgi:hypothetical protein
MKKKKNVAELIQQRTSIQNEEKKIDAAELIITTKNCYSK